MTWVLILIVSLAIAPTTVPFQTHERCEAARNDIIAKAPGVVYAECWLS